MIRRLRTALAVAVLTAAIAQAANRIVVLKVDGLGADLLYQTMGETDPATGKSRLPWIERIFHENGTIFTNFYTRGISLSAPSWSMLDTGHHTVIRGNAEYDRYTGEVYDYLNFFPFYVGYARQQLVDMPGVQVLDRAGIPLVIDAYSYSQIYQSFQLYQRGVSFTTLRNVLKRRFSSQALLSTVENGESPPLSELWERETEAEIKNGVSAGTYLYLDLYTGEIDHEGHATNRLQTLQGALKHLDTVVGRIWNAIQASSMATDTAIALVSDHGMNNLPDVTSQALSLPDLFNSPEGGAHHVLMNRHQLEKFKLVGLDPMVHRVITPSTASFYLAGQASEYPTAWLDLDGNERASVHLRNSDLNKIHILLQQLSRPDLSLALRRAGIAALQETIDLHRAEWTCTLAGLDEELKALAADIQDRRAQLEAQQRKRWTEAQKDQGEDKAERRLAEQLSDWKREESLYRTYIKHMRELLALRLTPEHPFRQRISDVIMPMSLGDKNTLAELQNYVAGPSTQGLVLNTAGKIDEAKSFRHVDYLALLSMQIVRNNPQPKLPSNPVDFIALRLPQGTFPDAENAYWLRKDATRQLIILQRSDGALCLRPVANLRAGGDGKIKWDSAEWEDDLPLQLHEDPQLRIPGGSARSEWLGAWHPEREWFEAIHECRYSNGVIGVTEQFSPVAQNVPGTPGEAEILLHYEKRRRQLVEPDFQVFAADHWNFNVRDVNPGGNHGSFLRISTHSVWMVAGAGVAKREITTPYDSLNFASTLLKLEGKPVPMPDRAVSLQ